MHDLHELTTPIDKACVQGVVTSISTIKKCPYFEGTLSDGTENTRLVGFTVVQQKLLSTYKLGDKATSLY